MCICVNANMEQCAMIKSIKTEGIQFMDIYIYNTFTMIFTIVFIYNIVTKLCSEICLNDKTLFGKMFEWYKHFKDGHIFVTDSPDQGNLQLIVFTFMNI